MTESVASKICFFLKNHRIATRPQLQRELQTSEKAIESSLRKLLQLDMVRNTGRQRREIGPRPAYIYELGSIEFEQSKYSSGHSRRGRPGRSGVRLTEQYSFDALGKVMQSPPFTTRAADDEARQTEYI
jgi:hypothetical protein